VAGLISALLTRLMRLLASVVLRGDFVARRLGGAFCIMGIAALAGCQSAPHLESRRTTPASATVRSVESSQTKTAQAGDDCGLSAYPVSRSTKEILAAVPRGKTASQYSTMFAKVAIDRQGRVTHLQVLRLAYPQASNTEALNAYAVDSIKRWRSSPVIIAGEPVAACSELTVTIDF